ncbi:MAG: hypothetical protein KJO29_12455 [Bacteroidia bacterium]|nr:hypothetical protein [Bacteroidia bacterium]
MIEILSQNSILLLFVVASLGYLIGNIRFKGSSLGVAAVLFTGLAFGAIDSRLQIPEVVYLLGLVLFVYSIGLSSGPAFFNSYKKNGLRDIVFIISMLLFSGLIAGLLWMAFNFSAATITGAYAGSTTNTPALAGVIDYITNNFENGVAEIMINQSVIGYSFSYPMGVLGGIISILIMEKLLKIDYEKEKQVLRHQYPVGDNLTSATVQVTNPAIVDIQIRDLFAEHNWNIVMGRIFSNGKVRLSHWNMTLELDDMIMIVGDPEDVEDAISVIGKRTKSYLQFDRTKFDARRIFVSNPDVVGHSIASLELDKKFDAIVTRIRRGDVDMLATGETVLEMGDRLRFMARREDLKKLSDYFGDSYAASSRVNLFSFGFGIGLGLILGNIEFNFGNGFIFKLGYAGGPLIVGLLLGALRRTGPLVWTLPYSANVTLQQIGLILLLAGIGVSSGHTLVESLNIEGLCIFMASVIISIVTAISMLFIGYKLVKIPFSLLMGIVSNQPAILDFANSRTGNHIPQFGYAMMFPLALIMKIVIAQILFMVLV